MMQSIGNTGLWIGFFSLVLIILAVDIFFLGRSKAHRISTREALAWSAVWIACAFIFNFFLWWYLLQTQGIAIANQKAEELFTAYLVEKALSVDNLFVFIMIFGYFAIPNEYQRRVLSQGVVGAVIMRLIVILLGIWLVMKIHWILYLFGLFLLFTGVKMLFVKEQKDLANNFLLQWLRKHFRITNAPHGQHFFIRQSGWWYATPLFLALVFVECSDLIFALDSIPAVFAVTLDPFIVFTSNVFAILGLRALYFLLVNAAARFYLLNYGIAIMLVFIGVKMLAEFWVKIPIQITLGMIIGILGASVLLSVRIKRKDDNDRKNLC